MIQYTCINRKGSCVYVRGLKDGKPFLHKEYYHPSLFVRCLPENATHRDFFGGYVREKTFKNAYEMSQYIKNYGEIEGHLWGNRSVEHQFILDAFGQNIEYSVENPRVVFMDIEVMTRLRTESGWKDVGFPKASEALYPINAICLYDAKDETFYQFTTADWSEEKSAFPEIAKKTVYVPCETEEKLLEKFLLHWKEKTPDVLTGWNTETFDIPYVINRFRMVMGEEITNQISPWGIIEEKEVRSAYGTDMTYDIFGVSSLDYLKLYKKYRLKMRKHYKLDYIAFKECGTRKAKVEGDIGAFYWENPQGFIDYNLNDVELVRQIDEHLKFISLVMGIAYYAGLNFIDTFSPIKTWDTLIYRRCMEKGIAIPFSEGRKERVSYEGAFVFDTKAGMQECVVSFDLTSLYPSIMRGLNISPEAILRGERYKEALRGIRDACDDPEFLELISTRTPFVDYYVKHGKLPNGVAKYLRKNRLSLTPNYQFYDTSFKSIFTELIDELFFGRKADKKKSQELAQQAKKAQEAGNQEDARRLFAESFVYDLAQQTKKILLNSLYGALGSNYFRYYMPEMAESITLTGQMIIRTAAKNINSYLGEIAEEKDIPDDKYIIAGDTDSVYADFSPALRRLINMTGVTIRERNRLTDMIDTVAKKVESDCIMPAFEKMQDDLNFFQRTLHMDREVICIPSEKTGYCGFWVAKKHYCLLVADMEGYRFQEDKPKQKSMGLYYMQSSCPDLLQPDLEKAARTMITDGEEATRKFTKEVKEKYFDLPVEEMAFPKTVSDVLKFIGDSGLPVKGTPVHSKAAIFHNRLLRENGLENKYEEIRDMDKMLFVYLKPNPKGFPVIGFKEELPKEFNLGGYVDYETHFDKSFRKPLEDMMESVGWSLEKKASLDAFF